MQKITPFLWYNGRIDDALRLYTSVFPDAVVLAVNGEDGAAIDGPISSARIRIANQELILFDGGPHFAFTPAASLLVTCDTQAEIDGYWEKLTAGGGAESRCGWLTDPFGLSWQIVPSILFDLLNDPDDVKSERARDAMLGMAKLDIAKLRAAFDGTAAR